MLLRKLFRTAWQYKAQFISMVLMIAIGVGVFLGFNIEWKSIEKDTGAFFDITKYADFRLYSETGFSEDDIQKIAAIDGINAASRFLSVNVSVKNTKKSLVLMVSENYTVSTMYITNGADYQPDADGIWLSDRFAQENNIAIGDKLTLTYRNITISGEVAGLCKAGEMMVCTADENQLMPDFETFGFAYITPKKLKSALKGAFYPQINIISGMEKAGIEKAARAALGRTVMVIPKQDHVSYAAAQSEVKEGKSTGSILPVLFLAIGVLTMVTTMHRIAANEKIQIGTLKALGFRDRRILMHYTSYGLAIGVIGTALGVSLGYGIAFAVINGNGMMSTYFDMPYWSLYMPSFCIPVMVLTVALLTLISFLSVKRMLRGTAADALRPYMPKTVKKSIFEKLQHWEKLPFGTKWNFRDILRHKSRSAMTLVGVVGCMILLVGGLGMKDTMNSFLSLVSNTVSNYKTKVNLSETAANEEAKQLAIELNGDWEASCGISYEGRTVELEIYSADNKKIRFVDEDNEIVTLSDEGAYLCLRLRGLAAVGDIIEFSPYGSEQTYKIRVAGYLRSVMTENIVMTAEAAERAGIPYHITNIYTDTPAGSIADSSMIAGKQDKQAIMDTYDSFMDIFNILILVLAAAAVVLGAVVLYNLGVMSYIERSREMATLKVLGFRDRKISSLLISQNIWLTVFGVIIGLPAGVGVLKMIIVTLASNYELKLCLGVLTYAVSIAVTFGVSLVVGWLVARKSRKIDMVEALKSAE